MSTDKKALVRQWRNDAMEQVDDNYINAFIRDADAHMSRSSSDVSAMTWENAGDVRTDWARKDRTSDITGRANLIREYLKDNGGSSNYRDINSYLDGLNQFQNENDRQYRARKGESLRFGEQWSGYTAPTDMTHETAMQYLQDVQNYYEAVSNDLGSMTWDSVNNGTSAAVPSWSGKSGEVQEKAKAVSWWLDRNKNILEEDAYRELRQSLTALDPIISRADQEYADNLGMIKKYKSAEDWEKAVRKSKYYEKHGGKSRTELASAIVSTSNDEEKQWLQEYSQLLRNEDDYDYEIAVTDWEIGRLERALFDYDRLVRFVSDKPEDKAREEMYQRNYGSTDELKRKIRDLKDQRYHLENGKKYNLLSQNKDFEEKSKYSGGGTHLQGVVNDPSRADTGDTLQHIAKYALPGASELQDLLGYENIHLMNDDERKIFNYIHNTQGEDAAEAYMDYLQDVLDERSMKKLNDWMAARTKDNWAAPIYMSALSTPLKFMSGEGIVDVAAQKAIKSVTRDDSPVNYNRNAMMFSNAGNTIRSSVYQQIKDSAGEGWAKAYNTGMSMVDSGVVTAATAINPVFGKVAHGLLTASAATDATLNAAARGASDDEALLMGIAAGFYEWFFERYEIDSLMKQGTNVLMALFKQSLNEAVGESATELCNLLTEAYVMGSNSDFRRNVDKYIQEHPDWTRAQAEKASMMDAFGQVLDAAKAGFFSGGIMGSAAAGINTVQANAEAKKLYGGWSATMISQTLKADSENKLALKLEKKLDNGKTLSGSDLRKLADALYEYGGKTREQQGNITADELMEGIEPVNKSATAPEGGSDVVSDLVDETIGQLTGAPADPLGVAVEGFRTSGTVTNKQATDILNNAKAVQQLVQKTGMKLPETASGKRAAVKEAVAKLGQSEAVVDSGIDVGYDGENRNGGIEYGEDTEGQGPVYPGGVRRDTQVDMQRETAGGTGYGGTNEIGGDQSRIPTGGDRAPVYTADSEGRGLTAEQSARVEGTAVTDEQGRPIAVYHSTDNTEFTVFEKGDTGFHFGSAEQAESHIRKRDYQSGRIIRAYLNIKKPIQTRIDLMGWGPRSTALYLWSDGILTDAEFEAVKSDWKAGDDYNSNSATRLREILEGKGYDGIAYPNEFEAAGMSYMVFHDSQIIRAGETRFGNTTAKAKEAGGRTGTPSESVGAAPSGFDEYSHLQFEYGNKPDRAGTIRDINVPRVDSNGQRVSDFAANLYGNVITDDQMVGTLETLISQGAFGAQTMKLDDVIANSAARIEKNFVDKDGKSNLVGFTDHLADDIKEGHYSPELLADAMVMMAKAQSEGDFITAGEIAFLAADIARVGGRILNVCKLTQRLSPEGQFAARRKAAAKVAKEVNKRRKDGKKVDISITEATEQEFVNVATAGEAIVTDAANALNNGLAMDLEAAADAAISDVSRSMEEAEADDSVIEETFETEAKADSRGSTPDKIGTEAGAAIAESAMRDVDTEDRLYDAIMEFAKSKVKKRPGSRRKATKALDALKEFYANRESFGEAWSAAQRRAEADLSGDPVAYDALRQFLDTGGYAQDVMDTYDSGSVTRKALREAARGADVELSRLISASLSDKESALQSIQEYVAQKYNLEDGAAAQMAHQLQEAFYRELRQRQIKRLRSLFGERNVQDRGATKDLFAELYNTGAFENGALISREALKKVFGHDGLTLSQELLAEYGQVSDARKAAVDRKIIQEIADQLPTDLRHVLGKWRYTAMLANPSTHLKNIIGGTGQFVIQYGLKDNLAALIEAGVSRVSGGRIKRTKAILNMASKKDLALIRDAYQDYGAILHNDGEIAKRIKNGGRYDSMRSEVEETRRSWKINNPSNAVTKGIDKGLGGLEAAADLNTKALDAEDAFFGRNAYALSLASYMKANNQMEITEEARTYAIAQAQECTFHDDSLIYQAVNKRVGKAAKLIVPFVKTPANVTSRAVEYSPGSILKAGYDILQIARQSGKTDVELNGKRMTAAQAIDDLSKGILGSAMWGIGVWLAKEGLIRIVGTGSEEEREYQRLMGYRDYSLCVGDICIDISCLSPAVLPVFTGAALYETRVNYSQGDISLQTVLDSIYSFTDPILSSSMLSGLDSFMYAIRSMGGSGTTGELAGTVGREFLGTYINQFFPSFIRRIAAGSDNTVRQTYSDPDNPFSAFTQGIQSGIPGARDDLKAKYDIWGQEIKQDASGGDGFWGAVWRTINPARVADVHTTDIDDEILRLSSAGFNATPMASNAKTVNIDGDEYRMTAEEYGNYERTEGQLSFQIAQKIIHSDAYQGLTDEMKEKALQAAYGYAAEYCKADAVKSYTPKVDGYLSGLGKDADQLSEAILVHITQDAVTGSVKALADTFKNGSGFDEAVGTMGEAYRVYASMPEGIRNAVSGELSGRGEAFVAAADVGVSVEDFATLYQSYCSIDAADLTASGKAQKWAYALDQAQGDGEITAEQKSVLKEKLGFSSGFRADSGKYDEMTASGVSTKTADHVAELMRGIEPENGGTSVRSIQRLEALVEDDDISDSDLQKLIPVYLQSDGAREDFEEAMDRGYSADDFVEAYRVVLDKEKGDKKPAVIREIAAEAGISFSSAKALYELLS